MEQNYEDYDSKKTSKFNSGMAQIFRLDILWRDAHRHSRIGLLDSWNWDLDRVWLELAGDLVPEDDKINKYEEYDKELGNLKLELIKRIYDVKTYNEKLYKKLMDKELFLRRLQNELGKGSAYIDEEDDMM